MVVMIFKVVTGDLLFDQTAKLFGYIKEKTESQLQMPVKLKMNDNCSTMISVRWEEEYTMISLHRIFMRASKKVIEALLKYIYRPNRSAYKVIRSFIDCESQNLDYSHKVKYKKLITQGDVYNLQDIFDEINEDYFNKELTTPITWYGTKTKNRQSSITFGQYHYAHKLIKIHRLLVT